MSVTMYGILSEMIPQSTSSTTHPAYSHKGYPSLSSQTLVEFLISFTWWCGMITDPAIRVHFVSNFKSTTICNMSIASLIGQMQYADMPGGSPCHHCLGYSSWHNDYCGVILHIRTVRYIMSRNVGALKVAQLHCSRQQCLVTKWSGRSVQLCYL